MGKAQLPVAQMDFLQSKTPSPRVQTPTNGLAHRRAVTASMIVPGRRAIGQRKPKKTAGVAARAACTLRHADCPPHDDINGNEARNPRQNARIEEVLGLGFMTIRR